MSLMSNDEEIQRMMGQGGSSPNIYSVPQRSSDDFERWRFDIEDLLVEKEYNIMGYFYDPKALNEDGSKGAWVQQGEPRVNEIGAKAIRTAMSGTINKISTLTNLEADEINTECRILMLNLNRLIFANHEKYGIQTPSDANDLLWQLAMFAFNGLKQSLGGMALKSLTDMSQTVRHYTDQGNKSRGFMGIFKGKKDEQ